MRGLKPIVEIMFGDFIALAADQIVNHASKYNWIYNGQVSVPMIIRLPVGGRRGYGPTHSQSLESMFMSTPGLNIVAPSIFHDPGLMFEKLFKNNQCPTLFVEYKLDYSKKLISSRYEDFSILRHGTKNHNENLIISLYPEEKPDILIFTYGGNVSLALEASKKYFLEEEVLINVCVLSSLKPLDTDFISSVISHCGRVLVLEEGNVIGGWGSEVSSVITNSHFSHLKCPVFKLGLNDIPIPSSGPLETKVLPSLNNLIEIFDKMINYR